MNKQTTVTLVAQGVGEVQLTLAEFKELQGIAQKSGVTVYELIRTTNQQKEHGKFDRPQCRPGRLVH